MPHPDPIRGLPTASHRAVASRAHPARRWAVAYLTLATMPLLLSLTVGRMSNETWCTELSLATGLAAASLLLAAYALPSRLRRLSVHLGIETVLRSHRVVAVTATALVLLHVGLVIESNPKRWAVLDLTTAPPRVWAGTIATVGLVVLVALALSRRRRRPRYEGWRLAHIVLAGVVIGGTILHVWWLHHLIEKTVMAVWFAGLGVTLLAVTVYRWLWRPVRSLRREYVVDEVRRVPLTVVRAVVPHTVVRAVVPHTCRTLACRVLACRVLACRVLACRVLTCRVLADDTADDTAVGAAAVRGPPHGRPDRGRTAERRTDRGGRHGGQPDPG